MFALLRMALFLCVVLALLPSSGAKQDTKQDTVASSGQVGASDAVAAASATVADMWQFCTRQAQACAIGSHAAVAFGQRAEAGAKMVYNMITERAAPVETGSIDAAHKPAALPSQDTLNAVDIAPAWQAPHAPRRVVRNKHGA
ncbi:MAG TPA: DUF5330 domain-containing protein [Xanthobacteraceae bacterium]|jgi:hypothetical protein